MSHPRAGQVAQPEDLVDVDALVGAYYDRHPDVENPDEQVAFGTSGHRGSSLRTAFNEDHILATTQAICDYRADQGFDGPLFIGRDTHGLSEPAWRSALEVLVGNGVQVLVDDRDGYTPTPAVSHAILRANRGQGLRRKGPSRRHRRHAVTQPALRRRFQVQPAARRPGRHRRDLGHRHQGQRPHPRRARRCPSGGLRARPGRGRRLRLHGDLRRRPAQRRRPRPHP